MYFMILETVFGELMVEGLPAYIQYSVKCIPNSFCKFYQYISNRVFLPILLIVQSNESFLRNKNKELFLRNERRCMEEASPLYALIAADENTSCYP